MGLNSQQVLSFIPADSWTPVFVMPGYKSSNGIYIISTNEKYLQRCNDIYKMALHSYTFEKVNTYKFMELVAVEIEGLWCRGRMLSYNEFLVENTAVELIDSGTIVKKQLSDLYHLPHGYKYDPLCLTIKPVNEIPSLTIVTQFYVQPLLLKSELHKGYVVVNIKPIEMINEIYSEKTYEEMNTKSSHPLIISTKDKCTVKDSNCNAQEFNKLNNHMTCMKELKKQGIIENKYVEFSDDLKEVLIEEKNYFLKTLLNNGNIYDLNNIFSIPNNYNYKLSLKYVDQNNQPVLVHDVIEYNQNNDDTHKTNNNDTSIIKESNVTGLRTYSTSHMSVDNIFKNGSSVEFCYGTNINFVYIRSYDQKKKYSKEMKQFYAYYKIKENLKIKTNITIGDMVAATLLHYNEIHRAVILEESSNHSFKNYFCFFIDIGCKEYVNPNHIFYLLEEAKNVPYLAHRVELKNIPLHNTMQLKYLKNYYDQLYLQPLLIEYVESDSSGLNKAILKRKSDNKDIYLDLKEFLQKKLSSFSLLHNKGTKLKITDYLKYNDLFKNGSVVLITHFISINQIYIRINTSELTEYYNNLITEVNKFYVNSKSTYHRIQTPKIGERVAVKSLSKKTFVRATISKKINDTTYLVHYIDYGDKEYVKAINIFQLDSRFGHLPQSVIKIGLKISMSINTIKHLPEYFNQLIQLSVPLIAEFDEEDPLGFQKIVLRKKLDGVNICEDICNLPDLL
ncbi:uncharacterized protein LOC132939463 [Metopolophium dirhodum]|uniref:uncharacterized protein LOC132939463 n=1 Tax=Metopolophium dirhodum TaxID=44670 RepID=UPI00298F6853|nr:uncharacterized protein LOC132939463 [Metopolophium dirhodum]XP_060862618.1 uncharacterized protein LOC132939463 [Metopolophium dirhodum]